MNSLRKLTGPAALFALAVLWSNIWGQLRDVLSSAFFSDRDVAAYIPAVLAPFNTPQIVTLALTAAMVPVLVELRRDGRDAEARRVAAGIIGTVGVTLALVSVSGMLLARPILELLFHWKPGDPTLDRSVQLSRVLYPYVLVSGISGATAATLQAFERFRPLAMGQLVPNLAIVACILALPRHLGIESQAIGQILGAAAYLAVVGSSYAAMQVRDRSSAAQCPPGPARGPWWKTPAARSIGRAMLPLILYNVADLGASQFAFSNAVSWVQLLNGGAFKEFQNAYRILQIPQGIFVSALVLVLLPYLSRFAAAGDRKQLAAAAMSGIRLVLYTVAPAVVMIGSLTLPIMSILYRHGRFTAGQASIAAILSAAMAPYVLLSSAGEVLVLTLLALKKVWVLLGVQVATLAAAAGLSYTLSRQIGLPGIALSVTVAALVNLVLLVWVVERLVPFTDWKESGAFLWKLTASCGVIWFWLWILRHLIQRPGTVLTLGRSALEIGIAVPVSAAIYLAVSSGLGIPEWRLVRGALVRYLPWRHDRGAAADDSETEDEAPALELGAELPPGAGDGAPGEGGTDAE